jgi:protein subunit release factor A
MSLNQLPSVLAGELDRFIDALIEKERAEQLAAE